MDRKIKAHFKKADPVLFKAISQISELEEILPKAPKEYFASLCNEIISQQLNGRVADIIFGRFKDLFPRKDINPKFLLNFKPEVLRSTGMSNSKVKFLIDLATKVESGEVALEELKGFDDAIVIEKLTAVKGIGVWTCEMFLIFSLGRENVFSFGDLGLNKAFKALYNLDSKSSDEAKIIVSKWSPYKSYASRILWRTLDETKAVKS